jgi:hypothetical protein
MTLADASAGPISTANKVVATAVLSNVQTAAEVCRKIDMPFYLMCALLEKESMGRNIYGHDIGSAMSVEGAKIEVTEENFRKFLQLVNSGTPSNGVGPMQITFKGFFTQMANEGLKPWVVHDNMLFGARLFMGDFQTARDQGFSLNDAIRRAGTKYNTGQFGFAKYGDRLLELAQKWRELVGS